MPGPEELESLLLRSLQFTFKDVDLGVSSRELTESIYTDRLDEKRAMKNSILDIGKRKNRKHRSSNGTCIMFT